MTMKNTIKEFEANIETAANVREKIDALIAL